MRPLVSVVTPFYNAGEFLEECISSVLSQTYQDFEYILVDNCSSDNSREIAQKYAQKDSRISLYTNERLLDQVKNYNYALTLISPQTIFCKIVQADDWVFERCIEAMVSVGERDERVAIVSSFRLAGTRIKPVRLPGDSEILPGRDVCSRQLVQDDFFFGSPTTVMYRSEIVRSRQPFFAEGRLHEDTEACYEILENHNFGFVNQILSFTRVDNDSLMSRARKFNTHLLDRFIIMKKYGRQYLDASQYEEGWKSIEQQYLRFLGRSKLRRRSREFWEYHIRGCETIAYEINSLRVYWQMLLWLLDLALNPKMTLARLMKKRKPVRSRTRST